MSQPRILLSKKALASNLEALIKLSGGLRAFPVLKANAYGLGIKEVARVLDDYPESVLPYFCVARSVELQQLRNYGVTRKLLLLSEWPEKIDALPANCEVLVTCLEDLQNILKQARPVGYQIKINTGMNRLGFNVQELFKQEIQEELVALMNKVEKIGALCSGICTHLASGEEDPEKFSHKQLKSFQVVRESLEQQWQKNFEWIHGLNSPAVLKNLSSKYVFNAFRPGIHLWGVRDPDAPIDIAQVVQLRVPIRQLYWIKRGDCVGYGRRYVADKDTRVAILNMGYADGLRRDSWSRNLAFYFKEQRAPLIGVVSMDMCAVDVTEVTHPLNKGDELEWIGAHQSVETISKALGTVPYEVFTSMSVRIERELV